MLSVIIPAHNEEEYLTRTIDNIFTTATGDVEVIVVLNGYDQPVFGENSNGEVRVIRLDSNQGERVAMNLAAKEAKGDYLFRIDAHCDFSPKGWDEMLTEVTGPKDITVAVLTALYHESTADANAKKQAQENNWSNWTRVPGHWYGFCRLIRSETNGIKGLEAKWQTPNRDHSTYNTVEPNMSLTGCGFLIPKDFYWEIGGADEHLPAMGAIGEEFGIKAYLNGGKVQTRTDVMVGHIFGTGGYSTEGTKRAQQMLYELFNDRYEEIAEKFPHFEGIRLIKTDQPGPDLRTVTVDRTDVQTSKDKDGKVLRVTTTKFRYIWFENEHIDEKDWTDKQIEEKYAPLAVQVGEPVIEYPPTTDQISQ